MKKTIVNRMKKKTYRAMGKLTAALILLGMSGACVMEASATETELQTEEQAEEQTEADLGEGGSSEERALIEQRVTYIYHQHIGSGEAEGGCYHGILYHTHKGSEEEGGECYQTPVYHIHTGDEVNGGECYRTPICHQHTGNPQEGGGCFVPVYHSHTGSCYKTISSSEYGCYVVRSWDTSDGDYEGHDYQYYEMSCGTTVHGTNSSHGHMITVCNRGGSIERYTLGCGKTEETPESYVFDCEKAQGLTIDSYVFDCEKTEQTIDGYLLSCGKDEETPCGKITVTEYQGSNKEETEIEISLEDLTGGELRPCEDPYTWTDASGNVIGTGSSITVGENGAYRVTVELSNEDINRDSLKAEISVDSIVKPKKENEGGSQGDGQGGSQGDGQGGSTEEEQGGDGQSEDNPETTPSAAPSATPSATPSPTAKALAAPENTPKKRGGNENAGGDESGVRSQSGSLKKEISGETAGVPPIPSVTPKRETTKVTLEERESENTELPELKSIDPDEKKGKLRRIFSSPAVQIISITAGTLAAVAGFLLLCYLLFMTVKVYNDDGEGKMVYLGRRRILLKEEGYFVEISEQMMEKAVTNRYCLKPGAFRLLRSKEELLVCFGQKKVSAPLSREMIVLA